MVSKRSLENGLSPAGYRPTSEASIRHGNMSNLFPTEVRFNVSVESQPTNDIEQADGEDDMNLEDICEVIISLKCKQCQFLCHDKATLSHHIRSVHSKSRASVSEGKQKTCKKVADKRSAPFHPGFGSGSPRGPNSSQNMNRNSFKEKPGPSRAVAGIKQSNSSASEIRTNSSTEKTTDNSESGGSILDEPVEDVFLCAECDIVFSSREMCCSHMHKVHGLKQFSADFIQEEIISKPVQESSKSRKTKLPKQFTPASGAIVSKKYRVTKDVFHTCSKCPIKFESAEVMKLHEQCHLPGSIKASKIAPPKNINAVGNQGRKNQLDTNSPQISQKGFICPVCDSTGKRPVFPKWNRCAWHLWKDHRIDCELYTCSVCKQFKSYFIARVKDHEQLHSVKANYKCKICNKSFKQLKQLRCHEKYHKDNSTKLAPDTDSRWYTPKECHICKRILSDSKCLKKHISAVHNKLKPYVCNICGHTSARKAELQLHHRQHTGEKPYKCLLCPFQTGDHNSLRKHKLRHSDERPYACPYCDYRCIQSCAFKKHLIASHPGQEVVYLCQICSHASVNETLFIAHQKDHAEGRSKMNQETESQSVKKEGPSKSGSRPGEEETDTNDKFWSGDDDSVVDIVDNGGVTIPASPQIPQTATPNNDITMSPELSMKTVTCPKLPQNFSEASPTKSSESRQVPVPVITAPGSPSPLVMVKHEQNPFKRSKLMLGKTCEKSAALSPQHPATPPQIFCVAASLQSSSPRHSGTNGSTSNCSDSSQNDIRGNNEDTESSSSEVITNPHQLIQNIQLTPLDLTDIIAFNEQSNDDGMLQRLLDMSGV